MNHTLVVKKVVDYIEAHLEEDLSLDTIASALNYSKFYIIRKFNEETKCTVYKYIQGRRLTLAAQKLAETDTPIIEIAYEAHYSSQQAFSYAFYQLYQCSPQIYRRRGEYYPKQIKLRACLYNAFGATKIMYLWGGKLAA